VGGLWNGNLEDSGWCSDGALHCYTTHRHKNGPLLFGTADHLLLQEGYCYS
jgi:hypothetical protein